MNRVDPEFLKQRRATIVAGLKEGVRREVKRLRKLGLPLYVAQNGSVVALPPEGTASTDENPSSPQ